jgi:hypothetical protein
VPLIINKAYIFTRVVFQTVSEIELFPHTIPKLLIRKGCDLLFLIRYLLMKWQRWYSLRNSVVVEALFYKPEVWEFEA